MSLLSIHMHLHLCRKFVRVLITANGQWVILLRSHSSIARSSPRCTNAGHRATYEPAIARWSRLVVLASLFRCPCHAHSMCMHAHHMDGTEDENFWITQGAACHGNWKPSWPDRSFRRQWAVWVVDSSSSFRACSFRQGLARESFQLLIAYMGAFGSPHMARPGC
jgi:hypothetical protein